jgi:hypothetical protein
MALTYAESNALMKDQEFQGRIKVACLKYADSIVGEPTGTAAHNTRLKWAQTCFQGPDMVANQVQPPVVMDAEVQADGAAITDIALQVTVETVVNKLM